MANIIHEGDVGVLIQGEILDDGVVRNISTLSAGVLYLKKPDFSVLTKTATKVNDGTDGLIGYTTIADDMVPAGDWYGQFKCTLSGGAIFHTTWFEIEVKENIAS